MPYKYRGRFFSVKIVLGLISALFLFSSIAYILVSSESQNAQAQLSGSYTISGTTMLDYNKNVKKDDIDKILPNAIIELYQDDGDGYVGVIEDEIFIGSVTSDDKGSYSYDFNIESGSELIWVNPVSPDENLYTGEAGLNDFSIDFSQESSNIKSEFDIYYRISANYFLDGSIDIDRDWDGVEESSVQDMEVKLYVDNGDDIFDPATDLLYLTDISERIGYWHFLHILPDTYWVEAATNFYDSDPNKDYEYTIDQNVRKVTFEQDESEYVQFLYKQNPQQIDGASIEGAVWYDNDYNGEYDPSVGDILLEGVKLNLFHDDGDGFYDPENIDDFILDSKNTDSEGAYNFSRLDEGSYVLIVDPESITEFESDELLEGYEQSHIIVDENGQMDFQVDFIFTPRSPFDSEIQGKVWVDGDQDGIYDPAKGDMGLEGVRIYLFTDGNDDQVFDPGFDDVPVIFVDTDSEGNYVFDELPRGTYFIDLILETVDTDQYNLDSINPLYVEIRDSEISNDNDFVFHGDTGPVNYTINGNVWLDYNNTGEFDSGDRPLAGTELYFYEDNGDGEYGEGDRRVFGDDPVIVGEDGTYSRNVSGLEDTNMFWVVPVNPDESLYTELTPTPVLVDFNEIGQLVADNVNIGYEIETETQIGDQVWVDVNQNGVFDEGEDYGLEGALIELYTDDGIEGFNPETDLLYDNRDSLVEGAYLFSNLLPGNYWVRIDPNSIDSDLYELVSEEYIQVTLEDPSGVNYDADFIFELLSQDDFYTINGYVWLDENKSGEYEEEDLPLPGTNIEIYEDVDGNGVFDPEVDSYYDTVTTDENGDFELGINLDQFFTFALNPNEEVYSGITENPTYLDFSQIDTRTLSTAFGFQELEQSGAQIGDFVWVDVNQNGVYDSGDYGLAGALIELYLDGEEGEPMMVTSSGSNGVYLFSDLTPGTYQVRINLNSIDPDLYVLVSEEYVQVTLEDPDSTYNQADFRFVERVEPSDCEEDNCCEEINCNCEVSCNCNCQCTNNTCCESCNNNEPSECECSDCTDNCSNEVAVECANSTSNCSDGEMKNAQTTITKSPSTSSQTKPVSVSKVNTVIRTGGR